MQAPDYVKTSTGFGTGGATVPDVRLMKASIPDTMKVKASGGMHSWQEAVDMVEARCEPSGDQLYAGHSGRRPGLTCGFQPHAHEKRPDSATASGRFLSAAPLASVRSFCYNNRRTHFERFGGP